LIHLIPEVLARETTDVHVGKVSERGGECPFGKSALARGFASPAHTTKLKGLADAETFVALRYALRVRLVAQSATVSRASHSEMTVNGADKVEFACDGEDGGHSTVGTRLDAQCFGSTESGEKVVGFSQVGEDEKMGLAVDTAGFDDPPVGMTADAVLLKAGHAFVYTIELTTEYSQKTPHPCHNNRQLSRRRRAATSVRQYLFVYTQLTRSYATPSPTENTGSQMPPSPRIRAGQVNSR
jgi:hypothetical protein